MRVDDTAQILSALEKCRFRVSTDTRKDITGTIFFALKGENFDGNKFIYKALERGATAAVTDDPENSGENIYLVSDVLTALQKVAHIYRKKFDIPIIAIGGSNGKTTSKELVREILKTKFRVHATGENLNNHIGVPLSILAMSIGTEVGLFEIGANHGGEHTKLLNILSPTHVAVTNNGLDHLEGFGSPEGVKKANDEIYDWARANNAKILERRDFGFAATTSLPLTFTHNGKEIHTHMAGDYNIENVSLAVAISEKFEIPVELALQSISQYKPNLKRSEIVKHNDTTFIVDCYNANPSSMALALESFFKSAAHPRGVILGDMLELGTYTQNEHEKILNTLNNETLECVVLVGANFKGVLDTLKDGYHWFESAKKAREWFENQDFKGFTFLLKGSRNTQIENVVGL